MSDPMLHNNYWPSDDIYMRWLKDRKVVRVACVKRGACLAVYPTDDGDKFRTELIHEVDDPGMHAQLNRGKVKDDVLVRLLDGEEIQAILRGYQPTPIGEERDGSNRFSYFYAKAGSEKTGIEYGGHGTFHICDDMLEQSGVAQTAVSG